MPRILTRQTAERDLIAQFVWYAENAGIEVAERFLFAANTTLEHLAAAPRCGTMVPVQCREIRGIRRWPVGGFEKTLLFYFALPDGVDLVRVLHGSRDLDRLFDEAFFDY